MNSREYIALHIGPPRSYRLRCIAIAWGVALLAVLPRGVPAVLWFPLAIGFAHFGMPWGAIVGWISYLSLTVAVFLPVTRRAFRYVFYALVIALTINVGACYKVASTVGRD